MFLTSTCTCQWQGITGACSPSTLRPARVAVPQGLSSTMLSLGRLVLPKPRCHAPRLASVSMGSRSTDVISQQAFFALVEECRGKTDETIDLGGRRVELREPLDVRGNFRLRIANGIIAGSGHAIIQQSTNRDGLLALSDLILLHSASPERAAKRNLGAALFCRGKSELKLNRCTISSEAGFGVWLVQRSSVLLSSCELPGSGRSSVVAFDQSRVECVDTSILDAMPHAICARGQSRVIVRRCTIARAYSRAIYNYHNSTLDVSDSHVSGTRSDEAAAVQMDALRPGDASTLTIANTLFEGNAGGDLSVSGNVERRIGSEVAVVEREAESFGRASAKVRDGHGELVDF